MTYKLFYRLADTVGDGSGTKQALGNYASTPTEFKVTAGANEHIAITRMIVHMKAPDFANSDEYGSGPALTNGIHLYVTDVQGSILYRLTDISEPVQANGEWPQTCYDFENFDTKFGAGNEYAAARWTFAKSGQPAVLEPGWSINVLCQDDFRTVTTGLLTHSFKMQGHWLWPRIGSDEGHA